MWFIVERHELHNLVDLTLRFGDPADHVNVELFRDYARRFPEAAITWYERPTEVGPVWPLERRPYGHGVRQRRPGGVVYLQLEVPPTVARPRLLHQLSDGLGETLEPWDEGAR